MTKPDGLRIVAVSTHWDAVAELPPPRFSSEASMTVVPTMVATEIR
jgi:hypothetical protein